MFCVCVCAVRLSNAADLDHHWVAQAWLNDVGLPQYSQFFHTHLVDGRLLSTLTRADLEKHLHVSKKAHQSSLLLGIQLLHMLNFNKEVQHMNACMHVLYKRITNTIIYHILYISEAAASKARRL